MFLWKGQQQTNLKIYYNKETFDNEHVFFATKPLTTWFSLSTRDMGVFPPTIRMTTGYCTFIKRIKKCYFKGDPLATFLKKKKKKK